VFLQDWRIDCNVRDTGSLLESLGFDVDRQKGRHDKEAQEAQRDHDLGIHLCFAVAADVVAVDPGLSVVLLFFFLSLLSFFFFFFSSSFWSWWIEAFGTGIKNSIDHIDLT